MNESVLRGKVQKYLGFPRAISEPGHELVMILMCAARTIGAAARAAFRRFRLTEVQFNLLMLLKYQTDGGMTQSELSRLILVNRANVTGLVDRLERDGYVERRARPADRRVHVVRITARGRTAIHGAERVYYRQIQEIQKGIDRANKCTTVQTLMLLCDILRERHGKRTYA